MAGDARRGITHKYEAAASHLWGTRAAGPAKTRGSVRQSLKFSIWDGIFTSMMLGVSENYLIPYGIALGATPAQVGLLASLPMLVAAFLQIQSARLTQHIGSRTKLINVMVFFHAMAWIPIILIPYFSSKTSLGMFSPWALLGATLIFTSVGAFAVPAWQSLMSDYIPTKKRGKYFGWRNRLQGVFTVLISILSGLLLNHFGKGNLKGFTVIFVFAMVCRFLAWGCLRQMVEPFRRSSHDIYFSFFDFIRQIRRSNFARFVFFVAAMSFAVNLSSPLLALFLLKDIGFNYASYMMVMTTASLSGFLFQGIWGKYGDYFGNLRALKISTWGIALVPIFWLFSHNLVYLFFVQIFAGCFWGGFSLLQVNFIMEAVSAEKKIRCLSYFNVVNSVATLLGAVLGGSLIHHLPGLFGYSFLTLFLISCLVRSFVVFFVSKTVREVR